MAAIPWLQVRESGTTGAGNTAYSNVGDAVMSHNATETIRQRTMLVGGTWSNLWVRVITNDRTSSATLQSRKNLADGNQIITIGAAATGEFVDTTHSDTVATGDEINWKWVFATGGSTMVYRGVSSLYTPASDVLMAWYATDGQNTSLNGVTRFYTLTGFMAADDTPNQTEANVQYSARSAGTWKGLFVNVTANAKGGNSFVKSRVNGADGTQTITIGSGVTGLLQDTTHSDSIVSGDEINTAMAYFADGNAIRCQGGIGSEWVGTSSAPQINSDGAAVTLTQALSITNYFGVGTIGIAGSLPSTTEAHVQTQLNAAVTATFLSVYVIANTLVGNTSFTVRKNGAAGNNTFNVGTAATGYFEDAANSDAFTATDEFDYQVVTPGVGTSIMFNNMAVVLAIPATSTNSRPLVNAGLVNRGLLSAGLVN